jgi:bacterioferritin
MNKMFVFLSIVAAVAIFMYMRYPNFLNTLKNRLTSQGTQTTEKLPATTENNLVTSLNKALADEWLAYYQYWIDAHIIKGLVDEKIKKELLEHAGEELKHADMLVQRILELGGKPLLEPKEWYDFKICGYIRPTSTASKPILQDNLSGEHCAVVEYKKLIASVEKTDPKTHAVLVLILADEEKHVKDLNGLLDEVAKAQ